MQYRESCCGAQRPRITPLLLLGGGGHCRSCLDVIETTGKYEIAGIVQPQSDGQAPVLGYPVLGDDDDLLVLLQRYSHALITVGQIKTPAIRQSLYQRVQELGGTLPVVVSPLAHVSRHATVEAGTIVMHGALVNAGAHISANGIINSQALIEHDVHIGAHCHISTGARVNGGVRIGTGCFIGSGAILREGITIGDGAIIGAGRTVMRDVPAGTLFGGARD